MDVLDKTLQPRKFKEYNLSRSLLQEPQLLWSSNAAEQTGPQFHNGLLMTSDGQKLVACGVEKVVWISSENEHQETLLPEANPWPLSVALVDGFHLLALSRGSQLHLCGPGWVSEVKLPEDPGDLLAATGATVGNKTWVSLLFVKKVNSAASPWYDLTLARVGPVDLAENPGGEPWNLTSSLHLFGSSAPLGACLHPGSDVDSTEVLVLSHGKYDFERPSLAADYEACEEQQKQQDVDELDEELGEMMRQQGLQLPKSRGTSAFLTLASSRSCQHCNLGLPAVTCRIYTVLSDTARMAVVLRTLQGHGAICHCWVEPEATGSSKIKVQHHQTFPGLAVVCDTPNLAYLSFSEAWAALGRWRSTEALQLFRHPKGHRSSVTQGLQLEGLKGLQVLGDHLFIWHNQGLVRYELLPEADSPSNQPGELEASPKDDWGEAPQADLVENSW